MSIMLTNSTKDYDWRNRPATDFYPTPRNVTLALIQRCRWAKTETIWEPACGSGHMMSVFEEEGYNVVGTDIRTGNDFRLATKSQGNIIVTNPPYCIADEFIRKARELEPKAFAFLLKSQYWHAATRGRLFYDIRPKLVMPLLWRPDFLFGAKSKSPTMEVLWTVWVYPYDNITTEYEPLGRPREGAKT